MNQQSQELPLCWQKTKVLAEIIGLILIPILIVVFTNINTNALKERESADRKAEIDKEIGVHYIEISVAILREDPAKTKQQKEIRDWALELLQKYSPVHLSPRAIETLRKERLPISVPYSYTGNIGAVGSLSADIKVKSPKTKSP